VAGNPEAFANAFWDVRYIDAYQFRPENRTSQPGLLDRPDFREPTTTTTLTTLATTTVTVFGPGNQNRPPFLNTTRGSSDTHDIVVPVVPIQPAAAKAPVNPLRIQDYEYLGCFQSSSGFSTFQQVNTGEALTVTRCTELCHGHKYAGVMPTGCFCADSLDALTTATQTEGICNRACPGNSQQVCGGIIERGGEGQGRLPEKFSNSTSTLISSLSPYALTVYGHVAEEKPKAPPPKAPGSNEVAPKAWSHKSWPADHYYSKTTTQVAEVTVFPVSEQGWYEHEHSEGWWQHESWNGNSWKDDGKEGEEHKEDGQHKDYKGEEDNKSKWNPSKPEITEVLIQVTKTVTDCPESTTAKEYTPSGLKSWDPAAPKEHWSSVPPFGPLPPSPTPVDPKQYKEHWSSVPPFGPLPPSPTPLPPHYDAESHPPPPPPFQTGAHPPQPPVVIAAAPGKHEGKEKYLVIMGLSILAVVMGVL
jgi:hypothetical protein